MVNTENTTIDLEVEEGRNFLQDSQRVIDLMKDTKGIDTEELSESSKKIPSSKVVLEALRNMGGGSGGTGAKGDKGDPGEKGDKGDPGEKGEKGDTGAQGEKGADGVSPTIETTPTEDGYTLTITDANGTNSVEIKNGKDGEGGGSGSGEGYKVRDNGFNETAAQMIAKMGRGWNLGNTLDGHHQQTTYTKGSITDVNNYFETWYKNFKATKKLIHYVKTLGFNSVRLPITWKDHISNGTIDSGWLQRVEEVVKWVLDENMYCIINVHHDGIYYSGKTAPIVADENYLLSSIAYLNNLWYQIADYFKDYNSKLIFACMNEILDINGSWTTSTVANIKIINKFNQSFVNTVRASGGNNDVRFCVCPTYGAGLKDVWLSNYTLPTDSASNKLITEVHYYPKTVAEIAPIFRDINSMLLNNNIPVIMGEYGVEWTDTADAIAAEIIAQADNYGIPVFYWDNGHAMRLVDRYTLDIDRASLLHVITGKTVSPKDYTYPINTALMPYYCKLYSEDSNSSYGGKYIVICSEYPITGFTTYGDDSGYYKITRAKYGKMAFFTSNDDITYNVLWTFLDNERTTYRTDIAVLGSTSKMVYVDGNYSISGWSDNTASSNLIEWSAGEELPDSISSKNNAFTLNNNGIVFNDGDILSLYTTNGGNAEFEVTISVPSIDSKYNGQATMLLRANGKHIGSLQFSGNTIINTSTNKTHSVNVNTLYTLKERIENGVGYLYINGELFDTINNLRNTENTACEFGGYAGCKVTHFKYTDLSEV